MKAYNFQLLVIPPNGMTEEQITEQFDLIFDKLAEEKGILVVSSFLNEIEATNAL